MIKNLPFQFKDLEVHIQKMLVRLGIVEQKVMNNFTDLDKKIEETNKKVDSITDFALLDNGRIFTGTTGSKISANHLNLV